MSGSPDPIAGSREKKFLHFFCENPHIRYRDNTADEVGTDNGRTYFDFMSSADIVKAEIKQEAQRP